MLENTLELRVRLEVDRSLLQLLVDALDGFLVAAEVRREEVPGDERADLLLHWEAEVGRGIRCRLEAGLGEGGKLPRESEEPLRENRALLDVELRDLLRELLRKSRRFLRELEKKGVGRAELLTDQVDLELPQLE